MKNQKKADRPRILVLEGLSGSTEAVRAAGGDVLRVRPTDIEELELALAGELGRVDGMLLTGGGDVDPREYGAKPHPKTYGVNESRDLAEEYALIVARENGWPVLGICRGMQLINVEAGGTLAQHVYGHRGGTHRVDAEPGTLLERAAGGHMGVVSLHHQEVDRVGDGLSISGWSSPDDVVEAIESDDGRVLGVQFHPEMDEGAPYADGIFNWLVDEAADRAGLPRPTRRERVVRDYWAPRRVKGKGRRRQSRTGIRAAAAAPVSTFWVCPHCAMRFDYRADRDDHVSVLHDGVPADMLLPPSA